MLSGSRLTGEREAGRRRIGGPLVGGGQGGWAPRAEASPQTSCGRTGERSPQQPFREILEGGSSTLSQNQLKISLAGYVTNHITKFTGY